MMQYLYAFGVVVAGICIGIMLVRDMYLKHAAKQTRLMMDCLEPYHRRLEVLEVFATELDAVRFQRLQAQLRYSDHCNAETIERKV